MIERIVLIVMIVLLVVYISDRLRLAQNPEQQFREDIAEVIASYTVFPATEILSAYDQFGSWDRVIVACMYASESGDTLRTALRKVWKP